MASNPRWLQAVLWAEGRVAKPLNRISNSPQAADVMLAVADGRRLLTAVTERVRSGAVHVLALPTQRDVEMLEAKVERLQRTLDEMTAEARDASPRPRPRRKTS